MTVAALVFLVIEILICLLAAYICIGSFQALSKGKKRKVPLLSSSTCLAITLFISLHLLPLLLRLH